jgi:hypothetical protein
MSKTLLYGKTVLRGDVHAGGSIYHVPESKRVITDLNRLVLNPDAISKPSLANVRTNMKPAQMNRAPPSNIGSNNYSLPGFGLSVGDVSFVKKKKKDGNVKLKI